MEINELENKLAKMGRSVRCIDSRNRPGHPPDYVCRFESGVEAMTCAYSYEAALAWAVLLVEPECPTPRVPDVCPECAGSGVTGSIGLPHQCPFCDGTGKRR